MPKKQFPCMRCEKLHAEMEDAEVCEQSHENDCDLHLGRKATQVIGSHAPRGDGTSGFKTSRRMCDECFAEWQRHHVAFEYVR